MTIHEQSQNSQQIAQTCFTCTSTYCDSCTVAVTTFASTMNILLNGVFPV